MKKMIILAVAFAVIGSAYAQDVKTGASTAATTIPQDNKTKVDPASLPDAVKTTLAGDAYKDWKISAAWVIKADPAYYTVDLKKEDKTTTVNIDANGKVK